jgi:hypothetical protein
MRATSSLSNAWSTSMKIASRARVLALLATVAAVTLSGIRLLDRAGRPAEPRPESTTA